MGWYNPPAAGSPATLVTVINVTTSQNIVANQNGSIFTNSGASGSVTLTLPTPLVGLQYTFVVVAAQTLQINATGGSVVIGLGELASTAGGNVSSNSPYSAVSLVCLSSTLWAATSTSGTWSLA
jgi:hypothetical protein